MIQYKVIGNILRYILEEDKEYHSKMLRYVFTYLQKKGIKTTVFEAKQLHFIEHECHLRTNSKFNYYILGLR